MKAWLALLVACGGPGSGLPDSAPITIDGGPPLVSGRFVELVADNDANGPRTRLLSVLPAAAPLTVTLDDGSSPALTQDEGLFSFPLAHAGQAYRVTMIVDGVPKAFDSAAPSPTIGLVSLGRIDRVPIHSSTPLTVTIGNFTPTDGALLDGTGVYLQTSPTSGSNPFTFDTGIATAWFDGKPSEIDASKHDQLRLVEIRNTLDGAGSVYQAAIGSAVLGISTHDGQAANVTANITVASAACLHVGAPRGVEQARFVAADPGPYSIFSDAWVVLGPAGPGVGVLGALEVAGQSEQAATAAAKDYAQNVNFGNVLGSTTLAVESATGFAENLPIPGGGTMPISVGTQTFIEVPTAPGCPDATVPAGVAAIPSVASVAGTPVTTDMALPLPASGAVPVSWTLSSSGSADIAIVELIQVATTPRLVAQVTTTATSTTFDRSLFAAGQAYTVAITTETGVVNAGAGDFITTTFPAANATSATRAFTVAP